MKNLRLMTTAAAILALGAGGAFAQGMKEQAAPEKAPAAQRQAPAEKVAPAIKHNEKSGIQQRSEKKAPETTGQSSSESVKPGRSGNAPMDADSGAKGDVKSKTKTMDRESGAKGERDSGAKSEMKPEKNSTTTGQGAASGSAKLSTEQRTKITTVFKQHRVEPTRLNISVRVGARVPTSVHFFPVPVEVIAIYPEWRGYDYILVGDEILIIDPRTHEIVAVLEA